MRIMRKHARAVHGYSGLVRSTPFRFDKKARGHTKANNVERVCRIRVNGFVFIAEKPPFEPDRKRSSISC